MELWRFKPGDTLLLHDGSRAEVLSPTEDGRSIRTRYVDAPENPALVGTESLIAEQEVSAFLPAPPGPEWGDRVVVVVHHVPESEETEETYEAITLTGTPLGVSIAADAGSAREALNRLMSALATFGYSGIVAVEDATEPGRTERFEAEIG